MTDPIEKRFEQAKVEQPERCLWAWRYAEHGHGLLGKQAHADHKGLGPPVGTILGVGGWTFCGRHTIRVLTVNEALAVEAAALKLPGLSWHLWENEPTDALPATEAVEHLKAARKTPPDDGVFTLAHVAMYARAKPVTCDWCRINLDWALEHGHVKDSARLGEAIVLLHRNHGIGVPDASWWDPVTRLYRP